MIRVVPIGFDGMNANKDRTIWLRNERILFSISNKFVFVDIDELLVMEGGAGAGGEERDEIVEGELSSIRDDVRWRLDERWFALELFPEQENMNFLEKKQQQNIYLSFSPLFSIRFLYISKVLLMDCCC